MSKILTDEQMAQAVNRFLGWKLPEHFRPDAGISFKAIYNENSPFGPSKHEPVGTNLFSAEQAKQMLEYVLADAIQPASVQSAESWKCFHCDEVFTDHGAASLHFGVSERQEPICTIGAEMVREMQRQLSSYQHEDTAMMREVYAMAGNHTTALMREEEKGYARGLADARKHPEELGLVAAALQPLIAVPDGWQLVPKEPTLEMLAAAEMLATRMEDSTELVYRAEYQAMLSASPTPPASQGDSEAVIDERAEFENVAYMFGHRNFSTLGDPNGRYVMRELRNACESWQARVELSAKKVKA